MCKVLKILRKKKRLQKKLESDAGKVGFVVIDLVILAVIVFYLFYHLLRVRKYMKECKKKSRRFSYL